jgi:hypothetical protein
MGALVADPNGFFLTVIAPCATACAPRLVAEGAAAPVTGTPPAQH